MGTYYLAVNRNKRSVVLDLNDEDDRALAHELSARADVFIQNFKPGGLTRFGLDYDSVRARNQGVIYCSISGFGAGRGASLPGYDLLVQGVSGLMSLTGAPDGPPFRSGISVFDVMTGLHSVIGILAALHHRDRTGEGQHVETNLLSSALSAMVNQTSAYVAGASCRTRMGNAHLSLFPYEPLATGDGELIVVAGNDGQFRRLAAAIGRPELADDERFDTVGKRNDNREELRPLLLEALSARSAQDWFGILTEAGLPCGPINTVQGGVELAESLGSGAGGGSRRRDAGAVRPQSDPDVGDPARLPLAAAGAGRARRARSATGCGAPPGPRWLSTAPETDRAPGLPDRAGRQQPAPHHPARPGSGRGRDGHVGFGELAFWLATQRRPDAAAKPGCSKPFSPRWPTTGSRRPRSSPG